ncbi:MAG: hypothetical protein WAM97_08975 [Acidimicrobiales bacterium]|jgi:hypothetical protein
MTELLAALHQSERIELSLPPTVDLVVLARFTAATIATRARFDVDEIEDLRLAVDELCVSNGPIDLYRNLRLEFRRADNLIRISCRFEPIGSPPSRNGSHPTNGVTHSLGNELSLQLLDALVDDHGRDEIDGRPCSWLEKRGSVKHS